MRRFTILGLALVLTAGAALAQAPPMPKPGPEHQRLHYFLGHWKHEGEMKAGPWGAGGKFTSNDHAHMLGNFFVASRSEGNGPMGSFEEMAFLGYDQKHKVYTYDAFASSGEHEHSTGTVSGKTWTWTADSEMGGKMIKGRYIIEEVSPTSYTYHLDTSPDGGKTWTTMMEGKGTKVK
jgi:Protein of unknown function (DUF1579)